MINIVFRPVCWITRHHWLKQYETVKTLYIGNLLPRDEIYYYQCQRCGLWNKVAIVNLDNSPKRD